VIASLPHPALPAMTIIYAMITPAILILATGNLIGSALMLHGRVVDRARVLIARRRDLRGAGDLEGAAFLDELIPAVRLRLAMVQIALSSYYLATGFFVLASLAIAFESALSFAPNWLATMLTIIGVMLLLAGCMLLFADTALSTKVIRRELDRGIV